MKSIFGDLAWFWGFALNTALIVLAQPLPLLTQGGWIHAGVLGTVLWGCLGWKGWLSVVIYFLMGSLVTRLGLDRKKAAGLAEARSGRRGPENVWGSAATATIIAILIKINFLPIPLLMLAFSASFSAKLSDTFGSEIGKTWGQKTFLLSNFKKVSPGTEGAISIEGLIASILGSILMTGVFTLLAFIPDKISFVLVSSIGFTATLIESLIGSTIQNKYNWMTNEVVNFIQTLIAAILVIIISFIFFSSLYM